VKVPLLRGRPWWLLAIIASLAAGALWLAVKAATGEARWALVEHGDLVLSVDVEGTLRATRSSLIGPPQVRGYWEYKISFLAPEGQEVAAGAPVLAFDTADLEQQLDRQRAESAEAAKQIEKTSKNLGMIRLQDELKLAEAQARLRKATMKVDRPGELSLAKELETARLDLALARTEVAYLEQRFASSQESAEAQLAALRAQHRQAERRIAEITEAIEAMTRKAPGNGTVIYIESWSGEKKAVGEGVWRAENVVELPDLSEMKGEGMVDEADAGKLREGLRVTLRLDAHPDVEFGGRVGSIWTTMRRKSWRSPVKVARLEIVLDSTDRQRMRPGMRFRGKVETERVADALTVPLEAVFLGADGPIVYRRSLFGARAVPVVLGRRSEDRIEVLEGLRAGQRVSLVEPSGEPKEDS
jgi:multidrug efflux pump subunit AcrA (membrane-fusion protein)